MLFRKWTMKLQVDLLGKRIYEQKMVRENMQNKNVKKEIIKNNKERMRSLRYVHSLFAPMSRAVRTFSGKVSSCIPVKKLKTASLTIESALVLPLFLFGCITMISFMDIYKLQTEHLVKLCEEAKTVGMYSYVLDGHGVEEITIPDIYSYKPIGGWISLPRIWMFNTVRVHAWTGKDYGDSGEEESRSEEEEKKMVYVTETGSVYHVDPDCTYLNLSVTQVSGSSVGGRTNQYGAHYCACEICSRNQAPASTVYITDSGTAYHNQASCSGLKRTVIMVSESEVENMRVCSRCGKQH